MADTFATHLLALTGKAGRTSPPARAAKKTKEKSRTTYATVVLMMAVGGNQASAATNGMVASGGGTSSGSLNISLVIPERIDAQGIADVGLNLDSEGALSGQTTACISGHSSGQYHLSAIGSGENGAFEATQGSNALGLEVAYSTDTSQPQPVSMGEALKRLTGAGAKGCADGADNATLSLRVAKPGPGTDQPWRGALTLLLAPE